MKHIPYRFYLPEEKMPKTWYNLRAAMPEKPEPLVNPGTGKPVTPDDETEDADDGRDEK